MNHQNATHAGTIRHRADDDLFHYDRSITGRTTECDAGLFRSKASVRAWVNGMRPRWLIGSSQSLVRPRSDG
jgi:hypothetical protein